jgi:uncharacterized integral membrane protein
MHIGPAARIGTYGGLNMEASQTQTGHGRARDASAQGSDRRRMVALGIAALAAIWLVAFILSNSESVRVSFVFAHLTLSLIWVMIICTALGAGLAWAVPRFSRRRR